jgi:O-antigen biosynthesis protein
MPLVVDVIIPVYRGLTETRACLESVLAHAQVTPHQVIVIDDASPEPSLAAYVASLAAAGRVQLLVHEHNQGFVRSVNAGMALHPERDVVLLNSDTEVANDWLDRLRACTQREARVATVTPFSNNATICSYPRIVADNPAPTDLAGLDQLFRQHNLGAVVRLPTGVGFCLYITRASLNALGLFDAERFGLGYGEEVDYCLRAHDQGWQNLLCADTFVYHRGGVSFQETRDNRVRAAQGMIDAAYPDYGRSVQGFIHRDPARPYRRAVDLGRLFASGRPRLLFISHAWGGGVERHVQDLAQLLTADAEVLLLTPANGGATLRWLHAETDLVLHLPLPTALPDWLDTLSAFGFTRVHYHHVQGFPEWVLDLPERLGLAYDITLHDYTAVCPQHHLIDAAGRYCGEPDEAGCNRCLAERPPVWALDIAGWRTRFATWLTGAARVIVPSADMAARLRRHLGELPLLVWPHPEPDRTAAYPLIAHSLERRRVLVLGSLSPAKGLALVSAAATAAARHDLPVDFHVIGSVHHPVPVWPESNLSLTGEYLEPHLPRLLEQERADGFLFASVIPETYSYTLSLAMRTGLPILALDVGAIGERLRDYPNARLLAADIGPDALLAAIADLPPAYREGAPERRGSAPARTPDAYRDAYLAALEWAPVHRANIQNIQHRLTETQPPVPQPDLPEIPAKYLYATPGGGDPAPPIDVLYEQGVRCGKREARAQLERELPEVAGLPQRVREQQQSIHQQARTLEQRQRVIDQKQRELAVRTAQVAELNRNLQEFSRGHRRHVDHLEAKISGLQGRIDELEGSTAWRLTAPLRGAVHQARRGVALGRALPRAMPFVRRVVAAQGWRALMPELRRRLGAAASSPATSVGAEAQTPTAPRYHIETAIAPLVLPTTETPLVSIIIPSYGQHALTYTCLKSIADQAGEVPIEVLLIDDCAPEPAADHLAPVQGLRLLRNSENLGFLRTCNRAAATARGRWLVLLNNDTIVLAGWLEALLAAFDDQPADCKQPVGAVGARLVYPDGRLQEAGGIVWQDGSAWNWGRNGDPDDPRYHYVREVDYCSAACLMVPKALFEQLGGFDERYAPAYYEDTDLCLAIRASGHRVLYQPEATVVHFEGASHGTDENAGLKGYQVRNRVLFRDKWAARLARHLPNAVLPERECDRVPGPRILWVEACMLTPDQDSGSVRTWRLFGLLRGLGCKVTFIADNLEGSQPYTRQLQQAGIEVQHYPHVLSVADYLFSQGAHYDAIVLCRHYIAIQYVHLARQVAPQARLIFDTIDLHYLRLRRQATLDQSAKTRRLAEVAYREELEVVGACDLTLVVSEVEVAELARELPAARVEIVSNVHDPQPSVAPLTGRRDVLFVGGFQHPPNVDAVTFYAEAIWPQFRALHPDARTFIIGSRMPETLRQLGTEAGLDMLGFVADLDPYLSGCRLSVSPLRYGAGVKGKINQALAWGLPVVATPPSVEGMGLQHDAHCLLADKPMEFADAMSRLYADDALWQRLSAAGQASIRERFSSTVAAGALRRVFGISEAELPEHDTGARPAGRVHRELRREHARS